MSVHPSVRPSVRPTVAGIVLDPSNREGQCVSYHLAPLFAANPVGPISWLVAVSRGTGLFSAIPDNACCLGIVVRG